MVDYFKCEHCGCETEVDYGDWPECHCFKIRNANYNFRLYEDFGKISEIDYDPQIAEQECDYK